MRNILKKYRSFFLKLLLLIIFGLNIQINVSQLEMNVGFSVFSQEDYGNHLEVGDGEDWYYLGDNDWAVDVDDDGSADYIAHNEGNGTSYEEVGGDDDNSGDDSGDDYGDDYGDDSGDDYGDDDDYDDDYDDNYDDDYDDGSGDDYDYGNESDPNSDPITPCEGAKTADHVYNTVNGAQDPGESGIDPSSSGGWELNNSLDLPPQIKLEDPVGSGGSGFNSALYQRLNSDGTYDYMYVTQGTDMGDIDRYGDWVNNIEQGLGLPSQQYALSISNARILAGLADRQGFNLSFSGHSLGGGMASANALATGYPATTYNAAGLSQSTKDFYNLNQNAKITAYVVSGELLNQLNQAMGTPAEGNITYISIPNDLALRLLTKLDPTGTLGLTLSGVKHMMGSVLKALGC